MDILLLTIKTIKMERFKITFDDVQNHFNENINKTVLDAPKADICFADFSGHTFLIVRRREKDGDFYYSLFNIERAELIEAGVDLQVGLKVSKKCGRALFFNPESYAIYEELDDYDLKLVEWE